VTPCNRLKAKCRLGHLYERLPSAAHPRSVRAQTRVPVEQASALGYGRYVGASGRVIGTNTFGVRSAFQTSSQDLIVLMVNRPQAPLASDK